MDLMGASELESSWPRTRIKPLPRGLLFFAQRLAHIGKQQEGVRRAVLPKGGLAQQPAIGLRIANEWIL